MSHSSLVKAIADVLAAFDRNRPVQHKGGKQGYYRPGIGPFKEKPLVSQIAIELNKSNPTYRATTIRTCVDLELTDPSTDQLWAMEFKIVRPFNDNGNEAEHWSQNLLHPYGGNTSLIGDALKLLNLRCVVKSHRCADPTQYRKCLVVLAYEHNQPHIPVEYLTLSFEVLAENYARIVQLMGKRASFVPAAKPVKQVSMPPIGVTRIKLGSRVIEKRPNLIHPVHEVLQCISWELS